MARVTLRIDGYPPAKSEALTMLGEGHPHAERVRRLLEAARDALASDPTSHLGAQPFGMSVVVYTTSGVRSDATNFLGGIADVLQDKGVRGAMVEHLRDLVEVDLFRDDAQIERIDFEFRRAPEASYTVDLEPIGPA